MSIKEIRKVVIAGGGLMGAGISRMFPQYGYDTIWQATLRLFPSMI